MAKESKEVEAVRFQQSKFLDHVTEFLKVEERTEKRNYTKKQKVACNIAFSILLVLFITSLGGFFIVWCTNYYDEAIQEKLILTNGTQAKTWWEKTPIFPLLKVHIFNYTNVNEFLAKKDDRLRVEDLGPITYKEITEKIDLVHHEDNTITYKEHRRYEYLPELSTSLKPYDEVTVPNIPFIIADKKLSETGYIAQISATTFINSLKPSPKPFTTLPATKFLWGYDDPIINSYKTLSSFTGETVMFDRFGMIATRNGTSRDNYTIHTGIGDISQLGLFTATNGEKEMNLYLDGECNRIDGTDGSQFPPYLMHKKSQLNVFIKNICRKFPLVFDKEVSVSFDSNLQIPAFRYRNPDDVFSHPDNNPQNQCYCDKTCPPEGIVNITKCAYGMPILASFPHFYLGDKDLINKFDGLHPQKELHETYADIHPRLAFPLAGVSRFQINLELTNRNAFITLEPFAEKYNILPVVWLEVTGGEIPDELKELIYHSTHSVNAFQSNLRYASALSVIVTFSAMILIYLYFIRRQQE